MYKHRRWNVRLESFRDEDWRLRWQWKATKDNKTLSGCCFSTPGEAARAAEQTIDAKEGK
jgi:hypothetical protein